MSPSRRLFYLAAAILCALLLSYLVTDLVEQVIIAPLSYVFWLLYVFYRMIPQQLYWLALLLVVLYIYISSLVSRQRTDQPVLRRKPVQAMGPVASLAGWLDSRHHGAYFKWRMARMLADLALSILKFQGRHVPGREIEGRDWSPPPDISRYLDAGLNTSFTDYRTIKFPFRRRPTPFDLDLERVVAYLESQLEDDDDQKPA